MAFHITDVKCYLLQCVSKPNVKPDAAPYLIFSENQHFGVFVTQSFSVASEDITYSIIKMVHMTAQYFMYIWDFVYTSHK